MLMKSNSLQMSATKLILSLLLIGLIVDGSLGNTRFLIRTDSNASDLFKTRSNSLRLSQEPIAATKSPLHADNSRSRERTKYERRNSFVETSTFNPDVLNKFLEDFATKMKSTTEKNYKYQFTPIEHAAEPFRLDVKDQAENTSDVANSPVNEGILKLDQPQGDNNANDTLERNKNRGDNPYDDRNGWVTLEAIPWSKSKISKWQANQETQKPWPEHKPWEKPQSSERPSYEDNVPWYEKQKPHYAEHHGSHQKPWYESERPKPSEPSRPSRPSYFDDNDFDERPNYAQKWPPENNKQSWNKYSSPLKETPDIITDDRPSNFPGNWEKPQLSKPLYTFDRIPEGNRDHNKNDWNTQRYDPPSKYEQLNNRPSNFPRPSSSAFDRPNFSQYQYSTDHPQTHPANGDGQWVLLSTNRGYSKSRQRSIQIGVSNAEPPPILNKKNGDNPRVAVMSSKRQVRLTVLPSVNGTNTTTSHGGLLEVEKTFKTVDQSQREYENDRLTTAPSVQLAKRPIRNTGNKQPSNSAVLAAVGAGMLPATMAMVIPMMLGRKKRSLNNEELENTLKKSSIIELNRDFANDLNNRRKFKKLQI